MKFHHEFVLAESSPSTYLFASSSIRVRLDFLDGSLRVALYQEGVYLFPTFCIAPNDEMPEEGRDKLSLEGFSLSKPSFEE
ncbi:MAG: hypothetical protein J5736_04415, partial [Bacilli bacterium]|nr:hypothetical protein [Bacilli bacterium]